MKKTQSIFKGLSSIEYYDLIVLCGIVIGMLYSAAILSFTLVFLGIRILFIGNLSNKIKKIKNNCILLFSLLSFFLLHVIGLLWTDNFNAGLLDLNKKLPFLIVPVAILIMSPLRKDILVFVFKFYITALLFGTLWAVFNYIETINIDTRFLISFTSNIRFGINIAFAVALMLIVVLNNFKNMKKTCFLLALSTWFVSYLFIVQALTGICILCILAIVAVLIFVIRKKTKIAYTLSVLLLMALIIFGFWIRSQYKSYFTPTHLYTQTLKPTTVLGNPYTHLKDKYIENGCYVNQYVCQQEMNEAWFKRTGDTLTDDCSDSIKYVCKETLKRYLNSKGLTKDAAGIEALTEKDIENIKAGNSNYMYAKRFSLKPRIYQTFFEFERYCNSGNFKDASITQRIELCRNALKIIGDEPVLGVGTGDNIDKLKEYLDKNPTKDNFDNFDPHNYYLYIMVQFGILGLVVLILFLIYPPTKQKIWTNPVFQSLFVITISAMFVESFFNLFSAMMLFCVVYSLLLFNKSLCPTNFSLQNVS
ncbi:MAG: O-antigen ligase family protein [Bacteroidales bacterium]|jgi:hypothetical protein|nr:O-antigen ligase family protein [Bacteroidales bacterium]